MGETNGREVWWGSMVGKYGGEVWWSSMVGKHDGEVLWPQPKERRIKTDFFCIGASIRIGYPHVRKMCLSIIIYFRQHSQHFYKI